MEPNRLFAKPASTETILKTMAALKQNNIEATVVDRAEEAKDYVAKLVPRGNEVFTVTSATLEQASITKLINQSGKYNSVRNKLNSMDRDKEGQEMRRLGSAPEIVIGSVHAITETGEVLIASNTGSQLAAYASGAGQVIWVVGAQKIVKDLDQGFKRIYEYSYPMEDARMQKAHGARSGVSKILIVMKEKLPGRTRVIFIKENIGF